MIWVTLLYVLNTSNIENLCVQGDQIIPHFDVYDPRNWKNRDNKAKDILVEKDHIRKNDCDFPIDKNSRHFSYTWYSRKLSNWWD